jgi:glyoxylase-like metal-dependent hydrolase (beta-lactamase superfamily II)
MRAIRFWTAAALLAFSVSLSAQDDSHTVDRAQYASRQVLPDPTAAPCPNNPRTLTQIQGNLYRHTTGPAAGLHSGLVLITSEGALVIDPAMTCTATALLDEIKTRFHVPVKYVVLTHAHFDHMAGSQVFQQAGATVIAHQNSLEPIVGEKLPSAVPDRVFDKQMSLTLGGETVVLTHVAPSHSDSLVLVNFPKYKALQCTDVCGSHRLPFNDLPDFYYDGWIETLDWVIKQDADTIDPGHGALGTTADQQAQKDYMVNLHAQVLSLVRQGQPWDQLYRKITFTDEQKKWEAYDQAHILNTVGMYRWVTEHRRGVW